jgi:hypothetical protein
MMSFNTLILIIVILLIKQMKVARIIHEYLIKVTHKLTFQIIEFWKNLQMQMNFCKFNL